MKDKINIQEILLENERRKAALEQGQYDPLKGVGCWGERVEVGGSLVPRKLLDDQPHYAMMDTLQQERLRIVEDFEFWCARCVTIRDKLSGQAVPFRLNRPQRRLLAVMEEQRAAGKPIRVILLKARQWGASTMVQMYLAWMQLVRHKGWNSIICAQKQSTSKAIKQMFNLMLSRYPKELLDDADGKPLRFTKLEGQPNVQQIEGRECVVITSSSVSEDAARGFDLSMAHFSEVAFWGESTHRDPDDVVRSVCGSILRKPDSVIVLESTADGVGTFFHEEWHRATTGSSDKVPLFVPWYEIGIYQSPVEDAQALWNKMDDYERALWDDGRTLEQINWYHSKRREHRFHEKLMAEFPGSASEAFSTTGHRVFSAEELERLAKDCPPTPLAVGEVQGDASEGPRAQENVHFCKSSSGELKVWEMPVKHAPTPVSYLVVVDVGGRSEDSDYSVIAVWNRGDKCHKPSIVAQWRGHINHDLLTIKAMQIAVFYNRALLVVESNTLTNEAARAGESDYILENLMKQYRNTYVRPNGKPGFHTNVKTKSMGLAELVAAVRDGSYIERDIEAVHEMSYYEERNNSYGARKGKHDDILMTRAIGLYLMRSGELPPVVPPPNPSSLSCDPWFRRPALS